MLKAKVSEIFRSIQGEGKYVGIDQIFMRLSGCQMNCDWCDTVNAKGQAQGEVVDIETILKRLAGFEHGYHSISFTGGEPLLQVDFLSELLPFLRLEKTKIYLETNGVLVNEVQRIIDSVDIVAMDFKLPSSTKMKASWDEHAAFLKVVSSKDVFVKVIVTKETVLDDIQRTRQIVAEINQEITVVLQPNSAQLGTELLNQCLGFQRFCGEKLKDVRVVPQIHKWLQIP